MDEPTIEELRSLALQFVDAIVRAGFEAHGLQAELNRLDAGSLVRRALEIAADWIGRAPPDHAASALAASARSCTEAIAWKLSPAQVAAFGFYAYPPRTRPTRPRGIPVPGKVTRGVLFDRQLVSSSAVDAELTELGRVVIRTLGGDRLAALSEVGS